jgi:hypothetical protein
MEGMLRSVTNNATLTDVTINISGNEVGPQGAVAISLVLQTSNNITCLIARNCGFKKEGIPTFFSKSQFFRIIKNCRCPRPKHSLTRT